MSRPSYPRVHTVDSLLSTCRTSNGWCEWRLVGGSIRVREPDLRRALEAAYDPRDPAWPLFVDL